MEPTVEPVKKTIEKTILLDGQRYEALLHRQLHDFHHVDVLACTINDVDWRGMSDKFIGMNVMDAETGEHILHCTISGYDMKTPTGILIGSSSDDPAKYGL